MSQQHPKKIENPQQFLKDSGFVFEINRIMFHPFGLSLQIEEDDQLNILDYRNTGQQVYYEKEEFEQQIAQASAFLKDHLPRLPEREQTLGFTIQEIADVSSYTQGILFELGDGHTFRVPFEWARTEVINFFGLSLDAFMLDYEEQQVRALYQQAKEKGALIHDESSFLQ